MKLCILSNLYPPYIRGGAEIIASKIAEALQDNLQHVFVITSKPYAGVRSLSTEHISINNLPVFRFYPLNLYYYLHDYRFPVVIRALWHLIDIFNLHAAFQIYRILKQERPETIMTHNIMGIGFLTPIVIRLLKIKHIHIVHDVQLFDPSGIILYGKEKRLSTLFYRLSGYQQLMKLLFSKVSIVISPSQFLMDFYRKHGYFKKSRVVILQNPVSLKPVRTAAHHSRSTPLHLLYVGQLTDAKGILDVISIVRKEKDLNIRLTIVGLGPRAHYIVTKTKKDSRVHYLGWKTRHAIEALFRSADMLVFPTLCYDNSPTVIYEALASGLPVLSSDAGGAKEIVQDGVNGLLFPVGDWFRFTEIIKAISEDKSHIQSLANKAQYSVSHLDVNSYIQKLLSIIEIDKS